jgi:hypothetical protein
VQAILLRRTPRPSLAAPLTSTLIPETTQSSIGGMPTRGACAVSCLMPNWLKGDNVMFSILPRTWFRRLRRQGQQQVPTKQPNPSTGFPARPRHRSSQCQRHCLPVRVLRCPTLCHRPRCTRVLSGFRWSQAARWSGRSFRRLAFWLIRATNRPPFDLQRWHIVLVARAS